MPVLAHTLLVSFLGLFLNEKKQSLTTDQLRPNLILQRAKSFIRDNFDKQLSLGMIAQYLNVSERHLSRLFSEGINESFITFIRKERVRQAAFLLQTTDLSIKEIAEATGFGTVHYFTRVFAAEKKGASRPFQRQPGCLTHCIPKLPQPLPTSHPAENKTPGQKKQGCLFSGRSFSLQSLLVHGDNARQKVASLKLKAQITQSS